MSEVNHFRRVALIWLASSVILTPIMVFVLAPGIPPGHLESASGAHQRGSERDPQVAQTRHQGL